MRVHNKWAILIGVNHYHESLGSLRYAVNDCRRLAEVLSQGPDGFLAENVILIADDQTEDHRPTYANIHSWLASWLSQPQEDDTVFVYFSGHGREMGGKCYLAPGDATLQTMHVTGIPVSFVQDLMIRCKAKQKILVLDACHSGAGKDVAALSGSMLDQIAGGKGIYTITSCDADELSHEWDDKKQGVFSYYFAEALNGACPSDAQGRVTAESLYEWVYDRVRSWAAKKRCTQTPKRFAESTGSVMFWTRRVMTVNEQEKLQFDDRLSDVHTSIEGIVSEVKKGYKQWHITNKLLFLGLLCSAGLLLIAIIISTNEYTLIQKASEGLRKGSVVAALSLEDRNFFFFRERALRVFENARKKNTETIDRVMKAFEIKEYQQVIKLVEMSWSATLPLEVENSYAESKRIIAGQKVQAERTRKRLVDLNSAKQACKDGNCRLLFRIVAMYPDDSEFSQLRKTFVGEFTNVSTLVVGGVRKWEDAKRIKRASGKVHMSVSSFSEYIGKRVCAEGVFRVRKAGWFYAGGYFVDTQNELIDMIEICFDKRFDSPERLAWLALKTVLEYVFMEELSTPAMAHLFGRIIVESIHHG